MIAFVFGWINFLIFFGLVGWAVKRYMVPWLRDSINAYLKERDALVEGIHQITRSSLALDQEIQKEKQLFEHLSAKIALWRDTSYLHEQEAQELRHYYKKKITDRRQKQQIYYRSQKLHEIGKERALNEVAQELNSFFSREDRRQAFMRRALAQLSGLDHE